MSAQFLDPVPIVVVITAFAIATLACYEIAFRLGRWWQDRMPGVQEGPTGVLVSAILGLMAFLLAITMGMASDRFDTRRGLVVAEANAIGKAYLQADYLPQPAADQLRELVREYIPLRIVSGDPVELRANFQRSTELQAKMWALVADAARSGINPDLISSLGDSLTDVVSLNESRVVSNLYARVPETVVLLLLVGSCLALAMVGYTAGLSRQRGMLSAAVMVVALSAVMWLVIDLDRPHEGLLQVSQQPLVDVQQWVGLPSS